MSSLYRPIIVRYVDPQTGKRVAKGSPGAIRKRLRSGTYRGKYRDADGILRTVSLCRDREAAKQLLNDRSRNAQLERAGIVDPFEKHTRRPLTEHIAEFGQSLQDGGCVKSHWQAVVTRVKRIVRGCGFRFISDISANRVQTYLAELKRPNIAEKRPALAQQTVNHYLRAVKQFANWLVTNRRTGDDRLTHLAGGNVKLDLRRERREIAEEELAWLLNTARNGKPSYGLTGWQRFTLYATAMETGLRASELASLTPDHFDLQADPPIVRIDAKDEKRGAATFYR